MKNDKQAAKGVGDARYCTESECPAQFKLHIHDYSPDYSSKHEHQYTIPVEWEYDFSDGRFPYAKAAGERGLLMPYDIKRVKKLRCPCGKETTR